jgi:DNA invertase Pin-like site-specific DNA recombinase
MPVQVGIYGRVSTADKGQEVENQLAELRRFAASQGWAVYAEYIDHESGKHSERQQFRALFSDAARHQFDIVLFWALDRFTREGALETLQHLNVLSGYGVGFRSFSEPYLDSCGIFKDAVIAILGTIAKQERVRISQRVRAGLERARVSGTRSGKAVGRPRVVFRRDQVAEMRASGVAWREIARRTGVSVRTVRRTFDVPALLADAAKPTCTAARSAGAS